MGTSHRDQLIRAAKDFEEVLKAYEQLAVRIFLFVMAIYGLIRALGR